MLQVRWLSTVPQAPAEHGLHQSASAIGRGEAPAEVRALADEQIVYVFGAR